MSQNWKFPRIFLGEAVLQIESSRMENLIYTWVQIVHNFGAVAVIGSPAAALSLSRQNQIVRYKLAWLMLLGWLAQGASGIGFALTSYTMKGALPEVTGIALGALILKVGYVHRYGSYGILPRHAATLVRCTRAQDVAAYVADDCQRYYRRCLP
jgi:hypothetical protein